MKVTGRFQQLRGFEEAVVRRYNESKGPEANVVEGDKFLEWCARAIIDNALFEQFLNGLVDFEAFRPDGKPVWKSNVFKGPRPSRQMPSDDPTGHPKP